MPEFDLAPIMYTLAAKRPIFHSEKDFQHALAWELQRQYPSHAIRLERRPPHLAERVYVDIWITGGASTFALELKYKTRSVQASVNGEPFELLNQSAQDIGRYDFLKDIRRLEQIAAGQSNISGYGLLLTNDSAYWSSARSDQTADTAFRLSAGRQLSGILSWGPGTGTGTMKNREEAIALTGTYTLTWRDYSTIAASSYGRFRFLLVQVK